VTGQWFSPGPPVSSTNKIDLHKITFFGQFRNKDSGENFVSALNFNFLAADKFALEPTQLNRRRIGSWKFQHLHKNTKERGNFTNQLFIHTYFFTEFSQMML
jgi:hypothetical protein